ncbi:MULTISPECIES: heavy metal-binding domain-containing protein [Methanothermobacter]|uniref:heavy metal-binding domain-containing protein n=1 Tax=Methanothermobacter TaxID=145260 RepID=UPI001FE38368|nr:MULTISPECIES: heavy metal-binding domain-containing protein [Methanothermobacter]
MSELRSYRWAILAVLAGLAAGLASAAVSVKLELIIFGFNIMYIVSPLLAGFMESYVAGRKYGASTGALSAILVFFAVNIYGWLFPAEPIQWNVFTVGGLLMAFQAAFPTTVNFILAAAITYALGLLGKGLGDRLSGGDGTVALEYGPHGVGIGIAAGEAVGDPGDLDGLRRLAVERMLSDAESMGGRGVVDIEVKVTVIGGELVAVTATGTAIE